jgi:hypothetical protein
MVVMTSADDSNEPTPPVTSDPGLYFSHRAPEGHVLEQVEHGVRVDFVRIEIAHRAIECRERRPAGNLVHRDKHRVAVAGVGRKLVAKAKDAIAVDRVSHRVRRALIAPDPRRVVLRDWCGECHVSVPLASAGRPDRARRSG